MIILPSSTTEEATEDNGDNMQEESKEPESQAQRIDLVSAANQEDPILL